MDIPKVGITFENFEPIVKDGWGSERDGRSRCLVVFAFGEGLIVLVEPGPWAYEVWDGSASDHHTCEDIDYEPPTVDGVYYGELTCVDYGAESWEMPLSADPGVVAGPEEPPSSPVGPRRAVRRAVRPWRNSSGEVRS